MIIRIALFILSVAAMAAFGLLTQARAETAGSTTSPMFIGAVPMANPGGPITPDFERGACYVAKLVNPIHTGLTRLAITIPGGAHFECP